MQILPKIRYNVNDFWKNRVNFVKFGLETSSKKVIFWLAMNQTAAWLMLN